MKTIREQCDHCRHFTGIGNDDKRNRLHNRTLDEIDTTPKGRGWCAAGVNYNDVKGESTNGLALPCFRPEKKDLARCNPWPTCPKASFKTAEELDAEAAEIEKHSREFIQRMTIVRLAILKDAGWVQKELSDEEFYGMTPAYPDRKSAAGQIPCPICKSGRVHYTISNVNGHVHAHCTTADCVSWME